MRRLVGVELTRLRWRRAVLLLLLGVLAVPVIFGVGRAFSTQPPSARELATAERQVAEEAAQPYVAKELKRCVAKPQRYGLDPTAPDLQAQCEELVLPRLEWFLYTEQLDLEREQEDTGLATAVLMAALLLLAGTTLVGHDWASGSMSNQLLFEPRRVRVWLAKAVAVVGVSFVVSLLALSAYWTALWALARSRDLPASTELLVDCLQDGARGAALAAGAALGGYALTMLFRSTVATLGVLLAVAVAGGALIGVLGLDERFQPQTNVATVVLDGADYFVEVPEECFGPRPPTTPGACVQEKVLPLEHGVLYLGSFLLLATAASVASFRRRDVP